MSHATVIVGASVAGVRTAQALRREGYRGSVTLVGDEPTWPYDKPSLSKAVLLDDADTVPLVTPAQAHADDIRMELGVRAEALDVDAQRVVLGDGRTLPFDDVVVATGAAARPSPWGDSGTVHVLRTAYDARRLGAELRSGRRLVVVGGGFIGAEVASAARRRGLDVHVVDQARAPMARVVGDELGRAFVDLHHRHGVTTHFGVEVEAIREVPGGSEVRLDDGTCLAADVVVVGIGTVVNDDWLRSSGLLLRDGVVCDEYSRAVDRPYVHAAGDVARWHHPRHGEVVRVEHWTTAVEQAGCVAHNIASPGDRKVFAPVEYVWTDQYDWKIHIAGCPWRAASSFRFGDPATDARFAALYADPDGRLCGAVSVNWPRVTARGRRAIAAGDSVEAVVAGLGFPQDVVVR